MGKTILMVFITLLFIGGAIYFVSNENKDDNVLGYFLFACGAITFFATPVGSGQQNQEQQTEEPKAEESKPHVTVTVSSTVTDIPEDEGIEEFLFPSDKTYWDYDYQIKGMNRMGITDDILGAFDGWAKAEPDNRFDRYAVMIMRGRKKVGYLPKGQQDIFDLCQKNGGKIKVKGYLAKAYDRDERHYYYFGAVDIPALTTS